MTGAMTGAMTDPSFWGGALAAIFGYALGVLAGAMTFRRTGKPRPRACDEETRDACKRMNSRMDDVEKLMRQVRDSL